MKKNISILIPDGESSGFLKALRCLSDHKNTDIYVLSSESNVVSKYSRYVNIFHFNEEFKDPEKWIKAINEFSERYKIDVILPTYISGSRKLIEYRHKLISPGKTLLPESLKIFDLAIDKKELASHMELHSIPHPKSWSFTQTKLLEQNLEMFTYPLLIKPTADEGGGRGIIKFNRSNDLKNYLSSNQQYDEVFLQEYMEGTDLGFNVLCKEGKILAYTIQLGTLFHDQAYKPQIGLLMIKEDRVLKSMSKLLKSLNWSGVAHIDLQYDIKSKEFKVLEINPRIWQTLEASSFAKVNFPWLYCQTVLGIEFKLPEYNEIEFLTFHGIIKKAKNNPFFLLRLRYLWKHTPVKYIIKDPVVYLILLFNSIVKLFSKRS